MSIYHSRAGYIFVFKLSDNVTRTLTSSGLVIPDNLDSEFLTIATSSGVVVFSGPIDTSIPEATPVNFVGPPGPQGPAGPAGTPGAPADVYQVVPSGTVGNNIADDTTALQSALSAATTLKTVYIPKPPIAYRISSPLTPLAGTRVILHPDATIIQSTKYKPVFDIINVDDVKIDGGHLRYEGDRTYDGTTGSQRGAGNHEYGSGVWTNGHRTTVRNCRMYGFECGVMVSGWNGTAVASNRTQDVLIDNVGIDTCDFGVLASGTNRLTIRHLYGTYAIAPTGSNGTPPPSHLIYITQTGSTTHADLVVSDCQAYSSTNSYAYQFKGVRGGTLRNLTARNCPGLITFVDCQDIAAGSLAGTADVEAGGTGSIYYQDAISERVQLDNVTLVCSNSNRAVRLDGIDCVISNLNVVVNRATVVTDNDITIQGTRNHLRNVRVRNAGAGGGRCINLNGTDCALIDPMVSGADIAIDLQAATRPVLDYDPGMLSVLAQTSSSPIFRVNGTPTSPRIRRRSRTVSYTVADATGMRAFAGEVTTAIVNVTTTLAFQIGNPYFPAAEMELTYTIINGSGGTLGTITWNSDFELNTAWANPASTFRKSITFRHDGTKWREISRS